MSTTGCALNQCFFRFVSVEGAFWHSQQSWVQSKTTSVLNNDTRLYFYVETLLEVNRYLYLLVESVFCTLTRRFHNFKNFLNIMTVNLKADR